MTDISSNRVWDFLLYATAALLVYAAMMVGSVNGEVYGMINLLIGAVLREIGSGGNTKQGS